MLKKIAQEDRQKRLWKCHQYEFHERSQENLPKKLKKIANKGGKSLKKIAQKSGKKSLKTIAQKMGKDRRKKIAKKRSPKKIAEKD